MKEITMKILNSTRLSQSYKTNYINRINAYIEAKYNYDVANIKRRELKNKLIKQTILLQRILKK